MATGYFDAPSSLEKLIHDCEFENQQYVKLIEHEDSLLTKIETETEWKRSETQRLEEANSQLDTEVKQLHRQFVQNKENIESQKKTGHILNEQIAAVTKKLDRLTMKRENERCEQERLLQHYKDICQKYTEKYESFPNVQELKKARAKEEQTRQLIQEKKDHIARMKEKMQFFLSKQEGRTMNKDDQDFIIKIAATRQANLKLLVDISRKEEEVKELKHHKSQPCGDVSIHGQVVLPEQVDNGEENYPEKIRSADVMDSPMISEREETEEKVQAATIQTNQKAQHKQGDPPLSWLSSFQRLQVRQSEPVSKADLAPTSASNVSVPSIVQSTGQRSKPPEPPYVAYRKTMLPNNQSKAGQVPNQTSVGAARGSCQNNLIEPCDYKIKPLPVKYSETTKVHLQSPLQSTVCNRSSSATVRSDAQAKVVHSLETVKRTLQQQNNYSTNTSSNGSQNNEHACTELLSMRPKIPKLDIKCPVPQTAVKTLSMQPLPNHGQFPSDEKIGRYRNPVQMIQMRRINSTSVQQSKQVTCHPLVNHPSSRISSLQTAGQQNSRSQMNGFQSTCEPSITSDSTPQTLSEKLKQMHHIHSPTSVQGLKQSSVSLQRSSPAKSPGLLQEQPLQSKQMNLGEGHLNEVKFPQNRSPNSQQQPHQTQVSSEPINSNPMQQEAVVQMLQLKNQLQQTNAFMTTKQRPITSVVQSDVLVSPSKLHNEVSCSVPSFALQTSPKQVPQSPEPLNVTASQGTIMSPTTEYYANRTAIPEDGPISQEEIKIKMLGPRPPYYLALKDGSSETATHEQNDIDNTSGPDMDRKMSHTVSNRDNNEDHEAAFSPFHMEKHKQRLKELHQSPEAPVFKAFHYKKAAAQTTDGSEDDMKRTSGPLSAFGGGDASDNTGDSFSLFGQSTEDKSGENFDLFGKSNEENEGNSFPFTFGYSPSTAAENSNSVLSLFGGGSSDNKEDSKMSGFSFNFGVSGADSPEKPFSLF